jgi:hypothetical protein
MTPLAQVIGLASSLLLLTALAGLLLRGHWRSWYSFALYAALMPSFTLLYLLDGRFYAKDVWMVEQSLINAVRVAMALELAGRTFRAFPGARSTLNVVVMLVVVTTVALARPSYDPDHDYLNFVVNLQPRLISGSVWLFTAIAALILWYRLPVLPFRKAILLSYLPYLIVSTAFLNVLKEYGWDRLHVLQYLNQAVYLALVSFWVRTAWKLPVMIDSQPPSSPSLPGARLKRTRTALPSLS